MKFVKNNKELGDSNAEDAEKTKTGCIAFLGFLCDLGALCEKYALLSSPVFC